MVKNINGFFANIFHGHETFADISNHIFNFMNLDHILLLANGYTEGIKMITEVLEQANELKSKYNLGYLIPEFLSNSKKVASHFIKLFDSADYKSLEIMITALGNFNKTFN
jgi:hypothetical protein